MIGRALAELGSSLRWVDLPPEVQVKARDCLLDSLVCAAAGRRSEPYLRLRAALARSKDDGACTQALLLGTAIHALEFDDAHKRSKTHPGSVVVPAALEAARLAGSSGGDTLAALVAGYEVTLRVGAAVGAAAHRRAGWHATGTCGSLGAAAAASRALRLDAERTAEALGHAVAQAAGNWAFAADGAMSKPLHAGNAARAGLLAALAAAAGFRGAPTALEAEDGGFFRLFGGDPREVAIDRGTFRILEVAFKPYPCCRTVQSAIDAALALRPADGPVHVRTFAIAMEQNGFYAAGNAALAPFSLPYLVAAALADGRIDFDSFRPERVLALAPEERHVSWSVDSELEARYPEDWGAEVAVGDRRARVLKALGDPLNPMSPGAWQAKLRACAGSEAEELRRQVEAMAQP